ncbi:MAG: sensor histidine kinase [Ardenticatenaceae bacterium]|nr:sensor histidine kinase [Ardenticatenaceae bacterium]
MSETKAIQPVQTDFWERWNWIWSAVFYLTLVAPAMLIIQDLPAKEQGWLAGMVLAACGWHWLWVTWVPRYQNGVPLRRRTIFAAIYLVGAVILWLQLIAQDEIFYIHLSGLFNQFFVHLEIMWAMVGTTLFTAVVILQNAFANNEPISLQDPGVWGLALGVVGANLFGLWLNGIISESNERRELLEALHQAQADLAASERRAGVLSERQRLAHEIHDTLAQGFIGIIMHLEAAQSLPAEQASQHVVQAEQMARQNLQQARYLVEDLRPEPLQQASLPDAIRQTVAQWQQQSRVAARVQVTGEERPLTPNTEHTLLRATQESLANVHKHAQASEVTVTLSYMGNLVMLDVQDDGVGLGGSDSQWQSGFGLTAMRQRVEQIGGTLLVESDDGEGTTVVVSIPVGD